MRLAHAVVTVLAALSLLPSQGKAQGAPDTTRIILDPRVIAGTLPNGLRYYVRENHEPEKRAELRLVVNAGSVLEDDDQRGLAHFTEHMAFNGTRHFEKNALVDYMRSIGVRWGPELNAYTSFDETVYILPVPTDTGTALARGMEILRDWADGQTFDTTEIRKERGVVLEEWRLGRGAQGRIRDKQLPVIFAGSRYADRATIGTSESITGFDPQALVRFYRDWYRPDLMAVVAVGDFDGRMVEAMIRERFGGMAAPPAERARTRFPVPAVDSARYSVVTDREAPRTSLSIYWRVPPDSVRTEGDFRRQLIDGLFSGMLNARLSELAQKPAPPFTAGAASVGRIVRGDRIFLLTTRGVTSGGETRALDALLTEAERARRHGFTEGELTRQKARILRGLEQAYAEREKTESRVYASQYVSTFLTGDPVPGIEAQMALTRRLLPGITLAEVNALPARYLSGGDRAVLVSAPEKSDVAVVTPPQLVAVFTAVRDRTIEPYRDELADAPLVPALPAPARIVSDREILAVGAREIRLGNGIRVLLKPTEFKADEILFQAFSLGGTTLVSEKDINAADFATMLATSGGLGRFSQTDLAKLLAGKVARVSPVLTETTQGLTGSTSPRDLETAFQLMYLTLTSPRVDSAAFTSMKQRARASLENRGLRPEVAFFDTLGLVLSQHSPRRRPPSAARLDSVSYGDALRIYRDRFADAGALSFIFVGSFKLDSIRPLIVRYLGALPSLKRHERPADVLPDVPAGVVKLTVRKGVEQKSRVMIVFGGPAEISPDENARRAQLASLFKEHLEDVVREELGGTYGVTVGAGAARLPRSRYTAAIGFGCAPTRVEELTTRIFKEIDKLRTIGPDSADVRKEREQSRRTLEVNLKENRWWLNQLYAGALNDWPPSTILEAERRIDDMSVRSIRESARRYFTPEHYVQAVLLPAGVSMR